MPVEVFTQIGPLSYGWKQARTYENTENTQLLVEYSIQADGNLHLFLVIVYSSHPLIPA